MALATWVWFIIRNKLFLKMHPSLPIQHWVSLIGVATLFWTLLAMPFFSMRLFVSPQFMGACLVLGIGSSWTAHYFWNCAVKTLPIVLVGQLAVFETIFGLAYIYFFQMRLPPLLECLGICFILFSIALTLQKRDKFIIA